MIAAPRIVTTVGLTVSLIGLTGLIGGGCNEKQEEAATMGHCNTPKTLASTVGKASPSGKTASAVFGAGCFWGVESTFRSVEGVLETAVGYAGGHTKNPTYKQVCSDRTGHAEVVKVIYDPARVSYEKLLDVFWSCHDPTTPNRQGPDIGSQYRSIIMVADDEQKAAAESSKKRLDASGKFRKPIVTEIVPVGTFYPAEEYHQQYFEKKGFVQKPPAMAH